MRVVPIESVREGTVLAKTIFDDDGRVLLREGVKLTYAYIKKIKQLKILSIYIRDEYSDSEIEDVIKPEFRQKAIKTVKETFFNVHRNNLATNDKKRDDYIKTMSDITLSIMDELLCKKNVLINMVDIKSMDNYTYQHCVNVAILSLIIGIELKLNKKELYDLCLGALMHDIGKVMIPKEILLKPGPLSDDEYEKMKQHTSLGYDYLKGSLEIPSTSRIIALYHHERIDGKGYPEKRGGDGINMLAKIVAVADVYDALTSDRPYRKAMSPNNALEYIMAGCSVQFDYSIVKAFAKVVVPYPEGSLVRLNNGDICTVVETFQNYPLRPVIKIVKSNDLNKIGAVVNLINELSYVIISLEYCV